MPAAKKIEVQNIGPVRKVSIPIPSDGGVVVLYGANGSGKSEMLTAVDKMLGRQADVADPTDGHDRGKVEGLGVTLTVGRTTRRTGELEVIALDSKLSVADLVDPGIKDPAAADEKRMRAVLSVLQVRPVLDDWRIIGEDDPALMEEVEEEYRKAPDVLVLSARLKATLSKRAKTVEDQLKSEESYVQRLSQDPRIAAQEDPAEPPTTAELADALTRAQKRLGDLTVQMEKAGQAAAFKAELDELSGSAGNVVAAEAEVNEMAATIAKMQDELTEMTRIHATKSRDLLNAKANLARIQQLQGKIADATAPDPEAIAEAELSVAEANIAFSDAETTRGVIATRKNAQQAAKRVAALTLQAKSLRVAVAQPEAILASLMASKVPGVKFEDGRMIYRHPKRGNVQFAALSAGERWRIAIGVAMHGVGRGGLITIPQEAWEGIQPAIKQQISEQAQEAGVVIITASCSDNDEIEAEIYGE